MQNTMMNYPLTLVHFMERAKAIFPGVEVVTRRPDKSLHRYTYADFYRRARALGEALTRAGMKPGDRVATLCWNHWVHLECYFGIPCAGGVLHTLNLRLHPDEIAYIANHAGDKYLVVDDVLLPLFEKFKDKVKFEKVLVVPFSGAAPASPATRTSSPAPEVTGRSRPSPKAMAAPCATHPAPPANPKASSIRTAAWCCIRWRPAWSTCCPSA
jgi:acyl-CoA synthetase (AMP-forming)/AMP-acid ligase II